MRIGRPSRYDRGKRASGGLVRGGLTFALMIALGLLLIVRQQGLIPGSTQREARGDHQTIELERLKRLALFSAGANLSGVPDLARLPKRLEASGLELGAPVLIRIFKLEFELEVWLKRGERFHHFATYPICRWSGALGPKVAEGDKQAPEGFYTVDASQLNPKSRWHRSFNLGFPNAFDRAHGRTGTFLMVHGGCSSVGCYAMTDPVIDELWRIIGASLKAGQARFQVQAYPFRMTDVALAEREGLAAHAFWGELKVGHDAFEATGIPPAVNVCAGRYVIAEGAPGSDGSTPIGEACAPRANSLAITGASPRNNRLAGSERGGY